MKAGCGWLLALVAACDQGIAAHEAARAPESFPHVRAGAAYDCSLTGTFASFVPAPVVESCIVHGRQPDVSALDAGIACVKKAEAAHHSFFVAREYRGTDSALARAQVVTADGVMYEATYDGDPCGGGCPEFGETHVYRCTHAPAHAELLEHDLPSLLCEDSELVETCKFGGAPRLPVPLAEGMRDALLGARPATLAPVLDELGLGTPKARWDDPALHERVAALSGGLVSVRINMGEPHDHVANLSLELGGPCTRVAAMLERRWGPAADLRWVDPQTHQQARLVLEHCILELSPAD